MAASMARMRLACLPNPELWETASSRTPPAWTKPRLARSEPKRAASSFTQAAAAARKRSWASGAATSFSRDSSRSTFPAPPERSSMCSASQAEPHVSRRSARSICSSDRGSTWRTTAPTSSPPAWTGWISSVLEVPDSASPPRGSSWSASGRRSWRTRSAAWNRCRPGRPSAGHVATGSSDPLWLPAASSRPASTASIASHCSASQLRKKASGVSASRKRAQRRRSSTTSERSRSSRTWPRPSSVLVSMTDAYRRGRCPVSQLGAGASSPPAAPPRSGAPAGRSGTGTARAPDSGAPTAAGPRTG